MEANGNILSSVEFWKFAMPLLGAVLTLLGAVVAWLMNERQKRKDEQYQRKEANYKALIQSLKGFYVGANDAGPQRDEFIKQLNLAWLYCPDAVIKSGYKFLETVSTGKQCTDAEKERALGEFVLSLRADLLSRKMVDKTTLTANDLRHLKASSPGP